MLTFVPHKMSEDYKKVEFYRVNKELCDNELYKDLSPTAILLYTLLCDRLSMSYSNIKNNISKPKGKFTPMIFLENILMLLLNKMFYHNYYYHHNYLICMPY